MNLLIVDDHALVRDCITLLIKKHYPKATMSYANCFSSAMSALTQANQLGTNIDLLLLDLNMPDAEQGDAFQQLCKAHTALPIIVVSAYTSKDIIKKALAHDNVYAFVTKGSRSETVVATINATLAGKKTGLVNTIEKKKVTPAYTSPKSQQLPPRLENVKILLKEGMSNRQIAQSMNLSEGTVKNYMSELFKKLNVKNRTQAASFDDRPL